MSVIEKPEKADSRAARKYACCRVAANMRTRALDRKDVVCEVCDACGRRHFRAHVDPGQIGARGHATGGAPPSRATRLFHKLSRA